MKINKISVFKDFSNSHGFEQHYNFGVKKFDSSLYNIWEPPALPDDFLG